MYNHKIRLLLEIRFIGHTKRAHIGHKDERTKSVGIRSGLAWPTILAKGQNKLVKSLKGRFLPKTRSRVSQIRCRDTFVFQMSQVCRNQVL